MYQVAVLPPPEALGAVEQFRRLHDPWFHRVPAHVALLPPFEPIRSDVLARFDDLRAAAFDARLGASFAEGTSLWLAFVTGADDVVRLRDLLHETLLDPAAPRVTVPPAVRVGHFSTEAAMELTRRGLEAHLDLPPFRVERISLLLEDVRGLWHSVRERVLRY